MFSQLITERMAGGTPALMEFGWSTGGTPGMMEFGIRSLILIPRRFDKVDILTGTPETDAFEVQRDGQIFFNPIITNGVNDGKNGSDIYTGGGGADTFKTHIGHVTIKDFTPNEGDKLLLLLNEDHPLYNPSEVDTLVYQEQKRATYLEGFQAPTARSYTYIEDFEPINDFVVIGGDAYQYDVDDSEFRVVDDLEFRIADDSLCEIPLVCF